MFSTFGILWFASMILHSTSFRHLTVSRTLYRGIVSYNLHRARKVNQFSQSTSFLRMVTSSASLVDKYIHTREVLLVPLSRKNDASVAELLTLRPQLEIVTTSDNTAADDTNTHLRWSAYHSHVNIDSTALEPHYLGRHLLSDVETAALWNKKLSQRLHVDTLLSPKADASSTSPLHYMEAGQYQEELDIAVSIVSRLAYASRSVQQYYFTDNNNNNNGNNSTAGYYNTDSNTNTTTDASTSPVTSQLAKVDMTPVTIVDYGVQAILLSVLHTHFPRDTFVAEEDSSYLRLQPVLTEKVLDFVHTAIGGRRWTKEELFAAIDLGSSDERKTDYQRAWVLDPIDGTKGFIRGEHYCIALGLLDYAKDDDKDEKVNTKEGKNRGRKRQAVLSVLGCPQLSFKRVLDAPSVSDKTSISDVFPPQYLSVKNEDNEKQDSSYQLFRSDVGSVFFAVKDMGAYMKALDMEQGIGYACEVSSIDNTQDISLCESREAMMATSRAITGRVRAQLGMEKNFVRLDGQCKHGLVGAGSVEGSLRLPPPGYIEKIWDHVPGLFFIQEAGGKVTDLKGREVDFSAGSEPHDGTMSKELSADVKGVIVSNGLVHSKLVEAVQVARKELKDLEQQPLQK